MTTQTTIIGLLALMVGGIGGYALNSSVPQHMMPSGNMMHGAQHSGMQDEMDAMMIALEGKTGDEFDKVFLAEMIMHHEGAVDMAKAALQNAKHPEIKNMANAIISAQTTEISQMQEWQSAWYAE